MPCVAFISLPTAPHWSDSVLCCRTQLYCKEYQGDKAFPGPQEEKKMVYWGDAAFPGPQEEKMVYQGDTAFPGPQEEKKMVYWGDTAFPGPQGEKMVYQGDKAFPGPQEEKKMVNTALRASLAPFLFFSFFFLRTLLLFIYI